MEATIDEMNPGLFFSCAMDLAGFLFKFTELSKMYVILLSFYTESCNK